MLITDTASWQRIIASLSTERARIAVISDFDYTITPFQDLRGKKTVSSVAYLRRSGQMSMVYSNEAEALAKKYLAYDAHPRYSLAEKHALCEEWYTKHFELMFREGLHKTVLEHMHKEEFFSMRSGFKELMQFCSLSDIPFIVMSAGLADVIDTFLRKEELRELVHIVGNMFCYDDSGKATAIHGNIIHPYTKNCVSLSEMVPELSGYAPTHVIVMGDHIGDSQMASCYPDAELLRVGFLDEGSRDRVEEYQEHFDVLFFGNSGIDSLNEVLQKCISGEMPA